MKASKLTRKAFQNTKQQFAVANTRKKGNVQWDNTTLYYGVKLTMQRANYNPYFGRLF